MQGSKIRPKNCRDQTEREGNFSINNAVKTFIDMQARDLTVSLKGVTE